MQTIDVTPVVEARGISKRYGPTTALHDASFRVMPGKSHALVGRNGAGKSTLVSILTGLRAPDTGDVRFAGMAAPPLSDRAGWRKQVACVYQHATVIPGLTVAENLFINRQPGRAGMISWREMRRQARALLDRWRIDVAVDQTAESLSVESRQLVEIARALSHGVRFVILDEPTAQLDGIEIRRLFDRMRELQQEGVTFLFISHHLQEVYELCQAVTVLRDARHILTAPVADLPKTKLIEAMTGEATALNAIAASPSRRSAAQAALAMDDVSGLTYQSVTLAVSAGEIVGLAGATSSGRTEIAEAVAGLSCPASGSIRIHGQQLALGDVPAALALGVGCVPQDRHRQGLVLGQSIAENATMTISRGLGPMGFIVQSRRRVAARAAITRMGVVTSGPDQPVSALSGGNQQKVVLARAMASNPDILVLIDPTAGVDVRSKVQLLGIIEEQKQIGKAILLASGEIEDLRLCDRVLVMHHGKLVAEFSSGWDDHAMISAIEGVSSDVR
ncbi:sugar ABC transporter ATP-binding protein [Acidisoma silvae]|uniref:Sugar ABC transporter ATP-binding protein n=1 Tax=Acidisoma silvae TaxID=2802396 RepID=A0A963YTS7_9PROT|nr:sugar ABC transporter ATP-binding protein [Acidisoma silvae]MCB8876936.1 sugar ABC transporter ATP-binding protein [Acidisoma silvae]